MESKAPIDLQSTYLSLNGKGRVAVHSVDTKFWQTIETNTSLLDTLLGVYASAADWPHWEMHPEGEEVLILLEGAMTLVLDDGNKEWRVPFECGKAFIVPRGVWHRALVSQPSKLIGLTYGAGTQHRPIAR